MDLEGIKQLIENNHAESLRRFEKIDACLATQKNFCQTEMNLLKTEIKEHDREISKIKTVGSLLSLVWGAIVLIASHIMTDLFRR